MLHQELADQGEAICQGLVDTALVPSFLVAVDVVTYLDLVDVVSETSYLGAANVTSYLAVVAGVVNVTSCLDAVDEVSGTSCLGEDLVGQDPFVDVVVLAPVLGLVLVHLVGY